MRPEVRNTLESQQGPQGGGSCLRPDRALFSPGTTRFTERARARLLPLLSLLLAAPACMPDFAPASELGERPQVLAIRAEPPEVAPGGASLLSALLHEPTPLSRVWIACFADPDDREDNCVAAALQDGAALSPCGADPQARLCVVSGDATALVEVPSWFVPVLPDDEGVPTRALVHVELVASTAPDPLSACGDAIAAVAPDDRCLLAVKRVVVTWDAAPNRNPTWAALWVDDVLAEPGDPVEWAAPTSDPESLHVQLTAELEPTAVDDAVNAQGEPDETFLDVLWYSDCGGFDRDHGRIRCDPGADPTAPPRCESDTARWSPGRFGDCRVHVVLYDGRGGVGWRSQSFAIVSPR